MSNSNQTHDKFISFGNIRTAEDAQRIVRRGLYVQLGFYFYIFSPRLLRYAELPLELWRVVYYFYYPHFKLEGFEEKVLTYLALMFICFFPLRYFVKAVKTLKNQKQYRFLHRMGIAATCIATIFYLYPFAIILGFTVYSAAT